MKPYKRAGEGANEFLRQLINHRHMRQRVMVLGLCVLDAYHLHRWSSINFDHTPLER